MLSFGESLRSLNEFGTFVVYWLLLNIALAADQQYGGYKSSFFNLLEPRRHQAIDRSSIIQGITEYNYVSALVSFEANGLKVLTTKIYDIQGVSDIFIDKICGVFIELSWLLDFIKRIMNEAPDKTSLSYGAGTDHHDFDFAVSHNLK